MEIYSLIGPLFGRIKKGERITLDDGRIVDPAEFIGPTQPGRKVNTAYSIFYYMCSTTVL